MTAWLEFLKSRNAVIAPAPGGDGESPLRVASFGAPAHERAAARGGALACPLLEWTALSVAGPNAASFLHAQFTNDVAGLAVGAVQYNGYCSPRGRVLANFPLLRSDDSEYRLLVPAGIASALAQRLRMFVLRAKVIITPLGLTHSCIGISGAAGGASGAPELRREEGVTVLALPDGRLLAICAAQQVRSVWDSIVRSAVPAGSAVWDWLTIKAGIPVITPATQDRFVPQMLNWELVGGVSFSKGCYPGQEIVARMQYLGKLKERLYRAHVAAATDIAAGAPLYGERFGAQSCGVVINAAPAPEGGADILAVVQIASAQEDAIRLSPSADAPALELLPLPYAVPGVQAK